MDNNKLADKYRKHQARVFQGEASIRARVNSYLDELSEAIVGTLKSISIFDVERQAYRFARAEKYLDEAGNKVVETYRLINRYHGAELKELAELELMFMAGSLEAFKLPDSLRSDILDLADDLVLGAPIKEWWERQGENYNRRLADEVRAAVANGNTERNLIEKLRGNGGLQGVSKRWGRSIIRTATASTTANVVRKAYERNNSVYQGIQQVSVFDGRTSDTCVAYAGKVWSLPDYKPVGHNLPYNGGVPRHPNCRSREIPVLLDEPPADDLSFDNFLKTLDKNEQDDLLGKGRATLYSDGKITLSDLVDQNGNAKTLAELKQNIT